MLSLMGAQGAGTSAKWAGIVKGGQYGGANEIGTIADPAHRFGKRCVGLEGDGFGLVSSGHGSPIFAAAEDVGQWG